MDSYIDQHSTSNLDSFPNSYATSHGNCYGYTFADLHTNKYCDRNCYNFSNGDDDTISNTFTDINSV